VSSIDSDGDGDGGSRRSARVRKTTRSAPRRQVETNLRSAGQRRSVPSFTRHRPQVLHVLTQFQILPRNFRAQPLLQRLLQSLCFAVVAADDYD